MSSLALTYSAKKQYKPLYMPPADIRYIDLWGGRGRGGSFEATLFASYRFNNPRYARIAFVRKIYNDVRESLWKEFKDRLADLKMSAISYSIADNNMSAKNTITGNEVKAFGVKADGGRTAKMKSLAGYNIVIIEEADELDEEEFSQLNDSIRTVKGDEQILILRIFNPPGRKHWIWKNYNLFESEVPGYWRAEPKLNMWTLSIFSTYEDNIKNLNAITVENYRHYKERRPEYYYTVICGLISEGQKGRIYKDWRTITDMQFNEIDARSIFALDFGWSDSPMAFSELKLVKSNVYWREHLYRSMTLKELAIEFCKLGLSSSDLIIADAAEQQSIIKLRTGWRPEELTEVEMEFYPQLLKGFLIKKAIKGPDSIRSGIAIVQGLNIHVTESSENILNEYREYRWSLDKDKNPTDIPIDKFNHHMDAGRYVISGRGRLF